MTGGTASAGLLRAVVRRHELLVFHCASADASVAIVTAPPARA